MRWSLDASELLRRDSWKKNWGSVSSFPSENRLAGFFAFTSITSTGNKRSRSNRRCDRVQEEENPAEWRSDAQMVDPDWAVLHARVRKMFEDLRTGGRRLINSFDLFCQAIKTAVLEDVPRSYSPYENSSDP